MVDRSDDPHCFRIHKDKLATFHASCRAEYVLSLLLCRVYFVSEKIMKLAMSLARKNLLSAGTCLGKFSKTGKFRLHITALEWMARYAKHKVCKPVSAGSSAV